MRRYPLPMRGAVAAGHQVTAETGARVLAHGGNAVDACVAAAFASWVAESTLTGPGGGGFMLVHRAHDRGARLLDFFVAVRGRGPPPHERAAMEQVDVDFDRATSQVFHIGAASIGVPGTPAGLEAAYRTYGTKPWPELVAPAIELAREGIELTRPQAYLHAILDVILRHTAEGRLRRQARRRPGRARPRRVSRRLAPSRPRPLPRPRVPLKSPAFLGRPPDRLRAAPARPARAQRDPGPRRGDRHARRGHARADARPRPRLRERPLPRRPRAPLARRRGGGGRDRSRSGAPRRPRRAGGHARNHPDLRRRRARERGLDDGVHRRRVGRDRARDGRAPEQHARRVRPRRRQRAAGDAPDEHDGALARAPP